MTKFAHQSWLGYYTNGGPKRTNFAFCLPDAMKALALSSAVYFFFAVFYFLLDAVADDNWRLAIINIGSSASFFVYWKRGRWGKARFDSFGAALLLFGLLQGVHGAIDAIAYDTRFDQLPNTVYYPESLMGLVFKSQTITIIGVLLVVSSWRMIVSERIENFSFIYNYRHVNIRLPWILYSATLVFEILGRLISAEFGPFQQIVTLTYGFGVAAIFFIAAQYETPSARVTVALGMALPIVGLALGSGMKEELFFPLLPALLLYWFGFKGATFKLIAIIFGLFVLTLSQYYVGFVRDNSWAENRNREYTTVELIAGFQEYISLSENTLLLDHISSRLNMTTSRSITVAIADSRGFEPSQVFGSIPASLVPRLLWPGKPEFQPGAIHTARIRNTDAPLSEISTASAAGFFAEHYLGGGYIGCIVGALFFGALLARLQLWTLKYRGLGFGHLALCFMAAYWAFRFDEKFAVYAYTSAIFSYIFIFLLPKHDSASEQTVQV